MPSSILWSLINLVFDCSLRNGCEVWVFLKEYAEVLNEFTVVVQALNHEMARSICFCNLLTAALLVVLVAYNSVNKK